MLNFIVSLKFATPDAIAITVIKYSYSFQRVNDSRKRNMFQETS